MLPADDIGILVSMYTTNSYANEISCFLNTASEYLITGKYLICHGCYIYLLFLILAYLKNRKVVAKRHVKPCTIAIKNAIYN